MHFCLTTFICWVISLNIVQRLVLIVEWVNLIYILPGLEKVFFSKFLDGGLVLIPSGPNFLTLWDRLQIFRVDWSYPPPCFPGEKRFNMRTVSCKFSMTSFLAAEIGYKLIKLNITSYLSTLTKVIAHCLLHFLLIDDAYINDRTS